MSRTPGDDYLSLFSDEELEQALAIHGRPTSEIPRWIKDLRSYSVEGYSIISDDFWLALAAVSREAADRVRLCTSLPPPASGPGERR